MAKWHSDITGRQKKIIEYYMAGYTIDQIVEKLKYKSKKVIHKFMETEEYRDAVKRYVDEYLETTKLTLEERLIKRYYIRATYNPADILNEDGDFITSFDDLGDLAYAIEGIETKITAWGTQKNIKLANREKAMEQLTKYIGICASQHEISGKNGNPIDVNNMTREERQRRIDELNEKRKEEKDEKKK